VSAAQLPPAAAALPPVRAALLPLRAALRPAVLTFTFIPSVELLNVDATVIMTTERIWTTLSRRSAITRSDFLNSSAMITVKIMPNTAWKIA